MTQQATAKVIRIGDHFERNENEIVTIDFIEFDHMRLFVKRAIRNMKNRNRYPKGAYEHSNFYVGRRVTRLSFFDVYCSQFQMNKLRKMLADEMHEESYRYALDGNNLHVYLRG